MRDNRRYYIHFFLILRRIFLFTINFTKNILYNMLASANVYTFGEVIKSKNTNRRRKLHVEGRDCHG